MPIPTACTDRPPPLHTQVQACITQLEVCGARWELLGYESAAHGFTNPAQDLNPREGFAYCREAAEASWGAACKMLEEELCKVELVD